MPLLILPLVPYRATAHAIKVEIFRFASEYKAKENSGNRREILQEWRRHSILSYLVLQTTLRVPFLTYRSHH
jgi:hypothetical protein